MKAPIPLNEAERLQTLHNYCVLDTQSEEVLDDLTTLIANICGVPIALISLVDESRQWFKSRVGISATETSREVSFCAHALLNSNEILEVSDAQIDKRFFDNPLVTGDPKIRFYAGAPLVAPNGLCLGTLCVIDTKTRKLTAHQKFALTCLSKVVINQLELAKKVAKLLEVEERLNFSFEGSGDGMWDWNAVTGAVLYSTQWKSMLGYDELEFKNDFKEWEQRVHPDDLPKAMSDIQAYLNGVTPHYINEHRMLCKDGSYKWILSRGMITKRDVGGQAMRLIGTHTDITPQKNIERALAATLVEAKQASLDKSKFLAAASHDLRQPLTALSLYVDVLIKQSNEGDSVLGKKIQSCVKSLSELLDNLLNVSKLDAGAVVPARSVFKLEGVLSALANIHEVEAKLKGLSLRFRHSDLTLCTDQKIFERMLGNLIANAIRYTDRGGVLIGCRQHNGSQWVEVWDTGIGFPSNMAKHIFKEFTQLGDGSRSSGSGLGLAIVGKSAELLNMRLRVCSRPGRGSMFAIEIPRGDSLLISSSSEQRAVAGRWRIALVDDNSMVLGAASFSLTAMGHEVIAGNSELAILKSLGHQAPDIIISDYRLADHRTGLDLISNARALFGKDLPAILITGDTDPRLIKVFADSKINVCYKPLTIDALTNLIEKVMLTN
ncbi:MAG: PAS domain-containing protein [Candidatus Nitrotoga sp.]